MLKKVKKADFPEDMEIWVITEYITDKEEIEDGFNRKTVYIKDGTSFVDAIKKVKKVQGSPYASIIIYKSIPIELKTLMKQINDLIKTMEYVNVYEVGREGKDIDSSYEYGTLRKLLEDYLGTSRTEYIRELSEDDKNKQLLRNLNQDIEILKNKVEEKDLRIAELNITIEDKEQSIKDLKQEIETEIKVDKREKEEEIQRLRNEMDRLKIEFETEKRKVLEYQDRLRSLEEQDVDKKYKIAALEETLTKKESELKIKQAEKVDLDSRIRDLEIEISDMMMAGTTSEKYEIAAKQLDEVRKEARGLREELEQTRIEYRSSEIHINELKRLNEQLRKGHLTEMAIGRTNILDKTELVKTDLVYIKIIDELPYFRGALLNLFNKIKKIYKGRAKLLIIRHDDGLDDKLLRGIKIFQSVDQIESDDKIVRISPGPTMFTGVEDFENRTDIIVVVDYIRNNEYLITTKTLGTTMTMVRRGEMLKDPDLGLHGIPLTLGEESIYDLEYSAAISRAGMKKNRDRLIEDRVNEWLSKLNIRK